jgi:hypothetical protein
MIGNFTSLRAYIATVAFANASAAPSEAPSAHLPADDAAPLPAPSAIVDKGKLITSAASRQTDGRALTDDRAVSLFRRAS